MITIFSVASTCYRDESKWQSYKDYSEKKLCCCSSAMGIIHQQGSASSKGLENEKQGRQRMSQQLVCSTMGRKNPEQSYLEHR